MEERVRGSVILVTGASSGIGYEAAGLLALRGHTVYAGSRRVGKMDALKVKGVHPVHLDVSDQQSHAGVIDRILDEQGHIDVLINNAGFGLYGPAEDISLDDVRYQFEVNLFGPASLVRAVLPHMRSRGSGRIVNVSSMGGKIYSLLGGWYHATKHALEAWSDCLRLELRGFGIDVVIVEPGFTATEFAATARSRIPEDRFESSVYAKLYRSSQAKNAARVRSSPVLVAKTIVRAVEAGRPGTRYPVGRNARLTIFLRRLLGDRAFDSVILRHYGLQ